MLGRSPKLLALNSGVHTFPERGHGKGLSLLTVGHWVSGAVEPSNEYDPNALLLHDESQADLGYLGYIDSDAAAVLAPKIRAGWFTAFLVTTAYRRGNGAWTVEVIVMAGPSGDLEAVRPALNELAKRVNADRHHCRYRVDPDAKGRGPYGLGFSLARDEIPAMRS